ncbi:MAG: glycosyltransferase [Gammaproteobacteria bacterium]|nr:MAG: glycosyltransferase [Gammaproteobacteria bacterium]
MMTKNLISIANIQVTSFSSMNEAVGHIIAEGKVKSGFGVAINAEKVVSAINNLHVMDTLQSATLRFADGILVVWAMAKKGGEGIRIPGCDLWQNLMEESTKYQTPVYIVGASPEVNGLVSDKLKNIGVNLVGAQDGYFVDEELVISNIVKARPQLVSVAMGSPAQEVFINNCRKVWPNAFYLGVGGTYDVYVEKVKRAPTWMQKIHLEWSYRLLKEPSRVFRQANLFKFVWLLFRRKI